VGLLAAARALAAQLAAGSLAAPAAAVAPQLIFNQRLDAWLTGLFLAILWLVILDMARVCARKLRGLPVPASCEAPYQAARLPPLGLASDLPQEGGI
jgi:carbon starvation protein